MNKVVLMGRLTKDPEVKQTPSNIAVCSFTIACDRPFKNKNGERETDFINCVAWRQQATLLGNYFHKGSRILLTGSIQTRSYDDNTGKRVYITEVMVETVEFVDKNENAQAQKPEPETPFEPVPVPPMPFESVAGFESDDSESVALPFDIT